MAAVERWFIRRGLPHFIENYSAGSDIWTRSLPILAIVYVASGLNALDLERWSAARNLLAAVADIALLAAVVVVTNLRARRRAFSVPTRVGPGELAVFVVGPALPSLLFGQPGDALQSVLTSVAVLLVVYVVTSYGLIPMTRWGLSQLVEQLAALGQLVVKALPLLLLFVTFLFMTAESWQVSATLYGPAYWMVIALFFVIGGSFVLSRVPQDLERINRFASIEEAEGLAVAAGAPVGALAPPPPGVATYWPLRRRAWANVVLVMLVTQAIQVTLVAVAMGAFLVAFGLLAVDRSDVADWSDTDPHVLWSPVFGGRELVLTEELLRVSGFLAAFTGLYFTVYLVTDATYREQFRDEVVSDVRDALAARVCYLASKVGVRS